MNTHRHNWKSLLVVALFSATAWSAGSGCSASPVGLATKIVGTVIDDEDVKSKAKEYIGKPAYLANEKLGQPIDTFHDVNSAREWRTYHVKLDPLNLSRYLVEILNNRIVAVTKAKLYGDPAIGLTQQTIAYEKVKGQTPSGCEAALGQAPLLTVRSEKTGQLIQLYDASLINIEGVTKPDYYIARFDSAGVCNKLEFVSVSASTKDRPTQG